MTPPAQRVQFILGEDHDDSAHQPHPLFSEMEELLQGEDGQMEWKETARYFDTSFHYYQSRKGFLKMDPNWGNSSSLGACQGFIS